MDMYRKYTQRKTFVEGFVIVYEYGDFGPRALRARNHFSYIELNHGPLPSGARNLLKNAKKDIERLRGKVNDIKDVLGEAKQL